MTQQHTSRWRRIAGTGMASVGVAAALLMGFGSAAANADVLDDLAKEYSTGAGAGQVANLLNTSLQLRAQGIMPKAGDLQAVKAAMDRRPNQGPLIAALSATVASQQKMLGQSATKGSGQSPIVVGIINDPDWAPGNPMEWDDDSPFQMPGR